MNVSPGSNYLQQANAAVSAPPRRAAGGTDSDGDNEGSGSKVASAAGSGATQQASASAAAQRFVQAAHVSAPTPPPAAVNTQGQVVGSRVNVKV